MGKQQPILFEELGKANSLIDDFVAHVGGLPASSLVDRELLQEDINRLSARVDLEQRVVALVGLVDSHRKELAASELTYVEAERGLKNLVVEVERMHAKLATEEELLEGLRAEGKGLAGGKKRVNKQIGELEKLVARRKGELGNLSKKRSKLEGELRSLRASIEKVHDRLEENQATLADLEEHKLERVNESAKYPRLKMEPLDGLPRVGVLYEDHGRRYLAISNWSAYGVGMEEASRLGAVLCAERE